MLEVLNKQRLHSYSLCLFMNIYLKKFIDNKKPAKALDLGAGNFNNVNGLIKLGWDCEGVDLKTGIDLENLYLSDKAPFDFVYSTYVLQFIKDKEQFVRAIYDNLKADGWFFIHTFDKSDTTGTYNLSRTYLKKILTEQGFKRVKTRLFNHYDKGHKHWHRILEATGIK